MNLDAISIVSDLDKDEIKLMLELQDEHYQSSSDEMPIDLFEPFIENNEQGTEKSEAVLSPDEINRLQEQREQYESQHKKKFDNLGEFIRHLIRMQMKGNNNA